MKMRLADYVAERLAAAGIEHVFTVTGGGAMHLNDAFGKNPALEVIYNHHEQACAMAAEGYARMRGRPALVCVTTGPGGTNAITGVLGAWHDSVPMLVISGQVRYDTTVRATGLPLRQMGDQEFDITRMVGMITKYALMVTEPESIRYHLERALFLATHGRQGPVWLDIPLNVQGARIDPDALRGYDPAEDAGALPKPIDGNALREIARRLKAAKRPVLMAGTGVHSARAEAAFLELAGKLGIPVVTGFSAHDLIPSDHPCFCGRPGTIGDRPGNFTVQNSDFLLVLGCRLNIRQIGYNWTSFARGAFKAVVDVDPAELAKPTLKIDLPVCGDAGEAIAGLLEILSAEGAADHGEWLAWCRERLRRYPTVPAEYWDLEGAVNPYCFVEALNKHLPEGQVVVTANASACICTFQAIEIKKGQIVFSNSGSASMGYDLPASIGACVAAGRRPVVCMAGDGSIQMNLQELQTIVHNRLPLKIFLFNNYGYHSIRQTQENFFGRPLVGCEPGTGVSFPDMGNVARAYAIPFVRCGSHAELDAAIERTMAADGPALCELMMTPDQPFAPKAASKRFPDGTIVSRPLEDMAPFLPREEFLSNMIIEPLPESLAD